MESRLRLWIQASFLLVAPALFLVLHGLFSEARGPFYLSVNYDPDYAYLFNGLNLANGFRPEHVDHPGVPLQLFAAAYLKLAGIDSGPVEAKSVISDPELHLRRMNLLLAIFYALVLLLAGAWAWRMTGQLTNSLMLQATPVLVANDFLEATRFRPETMILIIALVMAVVLFVQAWRDVPANKGAIGLLSFLAAAGLMAKITFFPFTLLPLFCLRTWKSRGTYAALLAGGIALWSMPLMGHAGKFFQWVITLVTHQGLYGAGTSSLFGSNYLFFLARLLAGHTVFLVTFALSVAVVIRNYGWRWPQMAPLEKRLTQLLAVLLLVQAINFFMAGKFGEGRYVVPALAFTGLNWAIGLALIRQWPMEAVHPMISRWRSVAPVVLILVCAGIKLRDHHAQLAQHRDQHLLLARALGEQFADRTIVYYYGSSSPYHALWFGNTYSGFRYGDVIRGVFPKRPPSYFVEEWPRRTVWSSVAGPKEELTQRLARGEEVILSGQQWPWPKGREHEFFRQIPSNSAPELELIRQQGDEAIYRLKVSVRRNP